MVVILVPASFYEQHTYPAPSSRIQCAQQAAAASCRSGRPRLLRVAATRQFLSLSTHSDYTPGIP